MKIFSIFNTVQNNIPQEHRPDPKAWYLAGGIILILMLLVFYGVMLSRNAGEEAGQ